MHLGCSIVISYFPIIIKIDFLKHQLLMFAFLLYLLNYSIFKSRQNIISFFTTFTEAPDRIAYIGQI